MVAERRLDGADSMDKSDSGSFVETSEDLKVKAVLLMAEARWTEVTVSRSFQMRQQFWEDELKFNAQELEAIGHSLDEAPGQLTTDTEDLKTTEDDLAEDTAALEDTTRVCQAKTVEFETATDGRSEESDVYAKAREVISQKTGGAESFNYGLTRTSFLQLSRSMLSSRGGRTKFEALWKAKELAKSEHSLELAQLASRVVSGMHAETGDLNTHVQHVVHTVDVERPRIIKQTVQKPIIQEKINRVTKHVGDQLSQFTDKVVDIPVVVQRQISIVVQTVQKTIESSQLQDIDEVVDVPVGLVEQVPLVRVMAETAEISQLACETCVKDNMFLIAGEINVAEKCHHETVVRGTAQNWSIVGSGSKQQQQHQAQATRQQPRKEEEEEKGRGEREKGRKGQRGSGQEGRKEEEREAEEAGRKRVEKDETGWTEVTRNKRKKMVQIFGKMDGGKTSAMEMKMNDKVDDIVKKIPIGDQDVYVTSGGRILRRSDKLKSCEVRDGSTVEVTSRMRGGGKHKDKKSKAEKQATSVKTPEQKCDGESKSDEARKWFEEHREYLKILDCTSEETEEEVQQKVQNYLACMQKVSWMTKEEFEHLEKLVRQMVETRRNGMDEDQDQRRQAQQGQEQSKQGKQVRFGDEQQLGKTGAENAGEPEVVGRTTEVRTGRGSAGLARGGDERCQADETSRKGKGKGNGGKGEHEGKGGGFGHKGKHPETREKEEEGIRMAPNMGAGGSHPQAMSDPRKKKETQGSRWADCNDEEGMKNEEEVEEEKEVGQRERTDERLPGLAEEQENEFKVEQEEKPSQGESEQEAQEEERRRAQEVLEQRRAQEAREELKKAQEAREEERRAQEAREEERRAQEAREEERRTQEAREEERRAQEAHEERKAQKERMEQEREAKAQEERKKKMRVQEERERVAREANAQEERERKVSAHEERREREREAEAQGGHESDVKAQEGHEGEVEEQGEDSNSLHEESHVSNRHMTWWHNAWWVRVNNGPHLRTARDRRRVWRAATRAAQEMRDTGKDAGGEREKREQGKTREQKATPCTSSSTFPLQPPQQPQQLQLQYAYNDAHGATSRPAQQCGLGLKHLRNQEYVAAMSALTPVKNRELCDSLSALS